MWETTNALSATARFSAISMETPFRYDVRKAAIKLSPAPTVDAVFTFFAPSKYAFPFCRSNDTRLCRRR